ncbi:fimbrial biogenesis usher protein [[Enterobacter] lignolyticus]|uniref:Outer membrane usher protein n=1 Tax=[Enterobacter] lignolyticus TaxID=1334193 RepID=A0A806X8B7_9ENTR|nr:fimbrial biogenesis usher protein [[Enterobacter] lignolyticus]ALR78154.1 outer membrane usher protein [[Enterobacter] lignolyticus]
MKRHLYREHLLAARSPLPPAALALLGALAAPNGVAGDYFNPAFLSSEPGAVADLSRFEGNGQAPGTYRVDVWLNGTFLATRDVTFNARPQAAAKVKQADDTGLAACLTPKALDAMGVNLQAFPPLAGAKPDSCVDIAAAIPAAAAAFDFEHQQLNLSVPQAAMRNSARGYIPPEQWDEGINALLFNYSFTGSNSSDRSEGGTADNSYFLGLNSGLNMGAWRLRDYSTWNYDSSSEDGKSDWQHINTYAQRDVIPLKGELTLGDSYTPSDVFDSLAFRGAQLASDDNMLPDSLRGFAPTLRGIAKSNAQVTVKQNGYTIYQSYVPPGPFAINDLYPTSSSGDLTVEVKESDGSTSSYTLPYSAVPILQREGRVKYAMTVAQYRSNGDQQEDVNFAQGTLIWGLAHGVTVYGGAQLSEDYTALAVGSGVNMGDYGALSMDITQATSTLADDSTHHGSSVRFLYAKSLNDYGTNFQLLGYRYSTSGFYTLEDTAYKHMDGYVVQTEDGDVSKTPDWTDYYNLYYTRRGKVQINVSQQLDGYGSVFITGSKQSYWHTDETDTLLQLGYSGTWDGISYSVSYNYSKAPDAPQGDQIYAVTLSLPIGQWLHPATDVTQSSHSAYATWSMSTDKHGNATQNAGVNGTLLADNNLSYSVQQGYQNHGSGASGTASAEYDGAYGKASVGYNYSSNGDYQQVNYGLSGGVVAHRNGITLSQPLGDTNVLIAAPGASDVGVEDQPGIHTDWRGYAVVPYATTYRQNRMALDTNSLSDKMDIDDAVTNVVPTQGALVRAIFNARVGERALLTLMHNGRPVPFGAVVTRSDGGGDTIVGDGGETYLSGLTAQGSLTAQWGDGAAKQCTANYHIPESNQPLVRQKVECS